MIKRPTNKQLKELLHDLEPANEVDCSASIMNLIKCGQIQMRSRWLVLTEYFGFRTTWLLLLILVVVIINLLLFSISKSPEWGFIDFGKSSIGLILKHLPYGWVALSMTLIAVLILMMKHFSWSYTFPVKVYVIVLTSGVVLIGGVSFASGINEAFYEKHVEAPGASTSMLAKIYCLVANKPLDTDRAMIGEVVFHTQHDLVIQTPTLEIISVKITENAPWNKQVILEPLQVIRMIGQRNGDVFLASNIKMDNQKSLRIVRNKDDCLHQEKWDHKSNVVEERRQVATRPLMPMVGTVQLIKSIR